MRLPSATRLLADGIVQVLRALAKLTSCELTELAEEVECTRYVQGPSLKGSADVDWTDPQARQRFLAEIVADAEQLLELVRGTRSDLTKDSPEDQELVAAAGMLARILAQDIERDESGPRLKRGVAPDRLISVHDPELRHGRKSSSHRFTRPVVFTPQSDEQPPRVHPRNPAPRAQRRSNLPPGRRKSWPPPSLGPLPASAS